MLLWAGRLSSIPPTTHWLNVYFHRKGTQDTLENLSSIQKAFSISCTTPTMGSRDTWVEYSNTIASTAVNQQYIGFYGTPCSWTKVPYSNGTLLCRWTTHRQWSQCASLQFTTTPICMCNVSSMARASSMIQQPIAFWEVCLSLLKWGGSGPQPWPSSITFWVVHICKWKILL